MSIDKLTPIDSGILLAAVIMGAGAFCPIVHLPIIGTVTYAMRGQGDGILIAASAAAIVGLTLAGYRRIGGLIALGALAIIFQTAISISMLVNKAQTDIAISSNGSPGSALGNQWINSVGLDWGWVPLVGGTLAVIVLVITAEAPNLSIGRPIFAGHAPDENQADSFAKSADERIAEYLKAQQAVPPAKTASSTGFGKRQAGGNAQHVRR
jgi:hypothetical protein